MYLECTNGVKKVPNYHSEAQKHKFFFSFIFASYAQILFIRCKNNCKAQLFFKNEESYDLFGEKEMLKGLLDKFRIADLISQRFSTLKLCKIQTLQFMNNPKFNKVNFLYLNVGLSFSLSSVHPSINGELNNSS